MWDCDSDTRTDGILFDSLFLRYCGYSHTLNTRLSLSSIKAIRLDCHCSWMGRHGGLCGISLECVWLWRLHMRDQYREEGHAILLPSFTSKSIQLQSFLMLTCTRRSISRSSFQLLDVFCSTLTCEDQSYLMLARSLKTIPSYSGAMTLFMMTTMALSTNLLHGFYFSLLVRAM